MIQVRTLDLFADFLDSEFAWRRKELSALWTDIKEAKADVRSTRLRSGVALLYAHWEGFIKRAAEAYLEFIQSRDLRMDELRPCLLAFCLRSKLCELSERNDVDAHITFLKFMMNDLKDKASIPKRMQTDGNLNAKLLKRIVLTLGLDYAPYELKEQLVDEKLLYWRNNIAHGKDLCPFESDFDTMYGEMTVLLRTFKDQVANAAALKEYKN